MATKLTRRVVRLTNDVDPCYHVPIMVCLEEGGKLVRVWQKGHRTKFTLTYADIWRLGYQAHVKAVLAERRSRKKKRKEQRL